MFKRENRLIPETKFGKSYLSEASQFVLKEKENGLRLNRFGVVVSKKVDKRAVVRNRIKRVFRQVLAGLNEKMTSGHDILLIVKRGMTDMSMKGNALVVENALKKAKIIKE